MITKEGLKEIGFKYWGMNCWLCKNFGIVVSVMWKLRTSYYNIVSNSLKINVL